MKTLLKVLAGIVLVVLLAAVALAIFIDPNDYKGEIQQLARKHAGMELNINGDLGWSLFPTLALSLPEVRAIAIEGESTLPVKEAQVRKATVSIDLLALLGGEIKMNGVLLDGLRLSLVAPEKTPERTAKGEQTASSAGQDTVSPGVAMDIASVEIRNARISYNDIQTGQRLELKNFNFTGTSISSSKTFPVEMNFDLAMYRGAAEQPELSLTGDLEAQLALDTHKQYYSVTGLDFVMDLKAAALNGKPLPLRLRGELQSDMQADTASVRNLRLELANTQLTGELTVSDLNSEPKFDGRIVVEPFALNPVLQALGQPVINTRDEDALKAIAFTANIDGPANTLGFNDVELRVDDSDFTGSLRHSFSNGTQMVKLQGTRLNVDRYLPPPSEPASSAPATTPATATGAATGGSASKERYSKAPLFPVDALKKLNFDVSLGLDELQASGITITNIKVLAQAAGGQINISEVSGDLYQGRFRNSAILDARKRPLALAIKKDLQGIQLGGLLRDLLQKDPFSGQLNMNGNYQSRGNSVYDIVHSLDGNMQVNLKDGRLNGVNLTDKLCSAVKQLKGEQPSAEAVDYTEFSNLSGRIKINDGVMNNQDLKASLVGISLQGAGDVNLPQEMIDYRLSLTILQELKGPNCQIDNQLHNIALPLRCKGSFNDKPASMCRPDTEAMKQVLANLGAKELETKAKEKLNEKLDGKLKSDVGDKLRSLFGR